MPILDTPNQNQPKKGDAIWKYIQDHQDDDHCFRQIMIKFNVDKDTAETAVLMWAMGDRAWFNETFK
jgi:hypothetical protein